MAQLIHNAIYAALTQRPARKHDKASLWVSELGRHPYGAIRRLMAGESEPFDYPALLKMDAGNALEAVSVREIAENIGQPIQTQFPVFNDIWSGYADLVIGHGTESVTIYDHKAAGGQWWDYKDSLPRTADCCQVWLYGQLYNDQFGILPHLGLYYRGWGAWAEFRVMVLPGRRDGYFVTEGYVTDAKGDNIQAVQRERVANPTWLRQELEDLYRSVQAGEFTSDDLRDMAPEGPEWDYAENAFERLRKAYGDED